MENASKALIMAGGVLLTIMIVSILMYSWRSYTEFKAEQDRISMIENTKKFNEQFSNYDREDVSGYELLSLVNKVIDYNQRTSEAGKDTGSISGNTDQNKPIEIYIDLYKNSGLSETDVANNYTTVLTIPARKSGLPYNDQTIGDGTLKLFTEPYYEVIDTHNAFGYKKGNMNKVLDQISKIEEEPSFGGKIGGEIGIQNLVKNINTIYTSKVISYNKGDVDKGWYEENYILDRYRSLTGVKMNNITDIRDISNNGLVEKVIKYYEYTQFKKSNFKCTNVSYDEYTGRVKSLEFKYTGLK